MPTADNSQTARTKIISGKELSKFHRLNPYSPQGGRYSFTQLHMLVAQVLHCMLFGSNPFYEI